MPKGTAIALPLSYARRKSAPPIDINENSEGTIRPPGRGAWGVFPYNAFGLVIFLAKRGGGATVYIVSATNIHRR